tara:strand:+ start:179 stop:667 length:489 start_codon:yes stop_codon:yes gene_type:complete
MDRAPVDQGHFLFMSSTRIAGIDYGTVRIGIATADLEVGIAGAYKTYTRRNQKLDAEYFCQLANEQQLAKFVVGLPVHLSGKESKKSCEARQFGAWLAEITDLPVEYFDERFTSAEAESLLSDSQLTSKKRKARLDQLAAQIMLTAYLDSGAKGQNSPGSIE